MSHHYREDDSPAIVKRSWQDELEYKIVQAVDQWWQKANENPFAALYLYFRRPGKNQIVGDLAVYENGPYDYELAWNQRLSPDKTKKQVENIIREAVRTLPIFNPNR